MLCVCYEYRFGGVTIRPLQKGFPLRQVEHKLGMGTG